MDAPFDRGEIDRASLDATERLRARLSSRPPAAQARRGGGRLPWVIAGSLFVFTAGMIANPWFERSVRDKLPFVDTAVVAPANDSVQVKALAARIAQLEGRAASPAAPMPVERLARAEAKVETSTDQIARDAERIDRISTELTALSGRVDADRGRESAIAAAAADAAERAQGTMALMLARRTLDAGRPLGPLETVLRRSFQQRYPQAVTAVAALGAAPATPATLRRDFDALRRSVGDTSGDTNKSWLATLASTVMGAVSRPADTGPAPLDAAAAALSRNDILAAANQLRRFSAAQRNPAQRVAADAWIDAANRWQTGHEGLNILETAVVLVPPAAVEPKPVAPAKPEDKAT